MRGEKYKVLKIKNWRQGSPPHARGKDVPCLTGFASTGITPACAGKSPCWSPRYGCPWDHPRMRGEKHLSWHKNRHRMGSPPHARGKELVSTQNNVRIGITPACAGKSSFVSLSSIDFRDHPRMRGEKSRNSLICPSNIGSPPHARGKALPTC